MAESDQNQKNLGTTCKNLGKQKKTKKHWKNQKKQKKTKQKKNKKNIRESWLGPPPKSLEIYIYIYIYLVFPRFFVFFGFPRFFQVFSRFFQGFFPSVGYCKETGMNHRQSCQSAFGSAVKHQQTISKDHLKLWENCTPRGCRSEKTYQFPNISFQQKT